MASDLDSYDANSYPREIKGLTGLKQLIRFYIRKSFQLQQRMKDNPYDWPEFQDEFNTTVDTFSLEIENFERANEDNEKKVYKFRKFFNQRLRKYFLFGHYINHSFTKPYGYAGDFKIIDDIYLNQPTSVGYERLWDNYFLRMGPSIATRNRKEDFKKIICQFVEESKPAVRIMNLASGPCREIKELFETHRELINNVIFDCYDFDTNAIDYAKRLLGPTANVNFYQKNAIRMAVQRSIEKDIAFKYDLIFSTGLFDYLNDRISEKLLANLKKLLRPKGLLCISNYRERRNNPWAALMEWIAEWILIYRSEEKFKELFLRAGFQKDCLTIHYEPLRIMQYCLAENR